MDILIDAFGGDHSPEEVIAGSVEALKERDGFKSITSLSFSKSSLQI